MLQIPMDAICAVIVDLLTPIAIAYASILASSIRQPF
jgi:hypothetical protein